MKYMRHGFTIVELLIVIVVVGILASITVVSYNGTQERAEYARAQSDMKNINDALLIYKSKVGAYPIQLGFTDASITLENFYPNYLDDYRILKAKSGFRYLYATNDEGSVYSLVRFKGNDIYSTPCQSLPVAETKDNPLLKTFGLCANQTWGYWSDGVNW